MEGKLRAANRRGAGSLFVVDGNLEGAEEFLVLGGPADLARAALPAPFAVLFDLFLKVGLKTGFNNRLGVRFLAGFVALVEADRGFEHEEDVVAGALDFPDGLGDAVGVGKRLVDRVAEFLHQFFESVVQGSPGILSLFQDNTSRPALSVFHCKSYRPDSVFS